MSKQRAAKSLKKRTKRRGRGRPARNPAPPARRARVRRPSRESRRRKAGYAGMPRTEWEDWRQVAETFVAERPHANDAQVVGVLVLCLGGTSSWGDFLAGRWLLHVGTEIYVNYVEGYSHRRAYQLIERFVTWMHGRGDLTDWQHAVLVTEIDDMRAAHGTERKHAERTVEMVLSSICRDHVLREFTDTLEDGRARRAAPTVLHAADTLMRMRLGDAHHNPLGSLDVEGFVAEWLAVGDAPRDMLFAADTFDLLGRFYRWLADTGRMDEARAGLIAWRLYQATRASRAAA